MGWMQLPKHQDLPATNHELAGVALLEDINVLIEVTITSVPWASLSIIFIRGDEVLDGISFLNGEFKDVCDYFPELDNCPAEEAGDVMLQALEGCTLKMVLEGETLTTKLVRTDGREIPTTDPVERLMEVLTLTN